MKIFGSINDGFKLLQSNIIVYQMGKVGSTTIAKSLHKCKYSFNHPHTFTGEDYFVQGNYKKNNNLFHRTLRYLFLNGVVKHKKPVKIITGVRDPVARNISAYYENFNPTNKFLTREELISDFYDCTIHDTPLKWFDNELKRIFNIDVFSEKFDKEKGFTILKNDGVECFVFKLEKLNNLEENLRDFLEIQDFYFHDSNVSDAKWYYQSYKDFKKKFVPTEEYIDSLYNTRYMKHFYSRDEINNFRNYWLSRSLINGISHKG